jgi:hypothetical protein
VRVYDERQAVAQNFDEAQHWIRCCSRPIILHRRHGDISLLKCLFNGSVDFDTYSCEILNWVCNSYMFGSMKLIEPRMFCMVTQWLLIANAWSSSFPSQQQTICKHEPALNDDPSPQIIDFGSPFAPAPDLIQRRTLFSAFTVGFLKRALRYEGPKLAVKVRTFISAYVVQSVLQYQIYYLEKAK